VFFGSRRGNRRTSSGTGRRSGTQKEGRGARTRQISEGEGGIIAISLFLTKYREYLWLNPQKIKGSLRKLGLSVLSTERASLLQGEVELVQCDGGAGKMALCGDCSGKHHEWVTFFMVDKVGYSEVILNDVILSPFEDRAVGKILRVKDILSKIDLSTSYLLI